MIMTENEAIDLDKLIEDAKVLAKEKDTLARTFRNFKDYGNPKSTITSGAEKAQKEAEQYEHISKLFEELKEYRAIGTIDQINEVIHFLDLENDNGLINDMTLLNQYRAIGTIEEFKALKEKSTPMKPIPNISPEEGKVVCWTCPSCKKKYWNGYYFPPLTFDKVCTNCLQAIDWD